LFKFKYKKLNPILNACKNKFFYFNPENRLAYPIVIDYSNYLYLFLKF